MKLTYQKRTGHERTRFAHTSTNGRATKRRESALERLEAQLKTKTKTNKEGKPVPLTEEDTERIKNEITILKQKTSKS